MDDGAAFHGESPRCSQRLDAGDHVSVPGARSRQQHVHGLERLDLVHLHLTSNP